MKKTLLIMLAIALATVGYAQEVPTPSAPSVPSKRPTLTPEQRAERQRKLYERTGGFVVIPGEGSKILYINAQDAISEPVVKKCTESIHSVTMFIYDVEKSAVATDPMEQARTALKRTDTAFVIVLTSSSTLPRVMFAPEERWGIVNVSALSTGTESSEVIETRFQRELWRATTWTMGGGTSGMASAMSTAYTLEELDKIGMATSPDVLGTILNIGKAAGVGTSQRTTFRRAAEKGLPLTPTDDIQRQILAEVAASKKTE